MRALIAFDKFKDSLTAPQACEVAARTLRGLHPDWRLDLCPLTDGGEGFAEILTAAAGGRATPFRVAGPRGGLVEAPVGIVHRTGIPAAARELLGPGSGGEDRPVAVVGLASASGLALLPAELRDPWRASTQGTGQLLRAAAELGASEILLGVGGSATHDLGLGALGVLGFEFRAADGAKLRPAVPAVWPRIADIEGEPFPSIPPLLIACDVSHPLLGPRGAAAVFGPQKGLKPGDAARLEAETARVAALLCAHCGRPPGLAETPGAGAAGGIAFGLMAAAGARLLPGSALVAAWLGLEERLAAADLVVTGEGRFDASSAEGKGPGAVAARAAALGKRAFVFAGRADAAAPPGAELREITPPGTPLPLALRQAAANLSASLRTAFA